MKKLFFLKQLFKDAKRTGAVAPSSPSLIQKMVENIDFKKAKLILELGPGNGCMTHEILKKMNPDAKLICLEINPEFYQNLLGIQTQKNLEVVLGCASELSNIVGQSSVDAVISGLPLSNFKKQDVEILLKKIKLSLKQDGKFVQFQYSPKLSKLFKAVFRLVKTTFTFINLPPALIYTCQI